MNAGLEKRFWRLGFFRDAAWLTRERVIAYARLMIVLQAIALIVLAMLLHGFLGILTEPTSTDFLSFYAAGHMADQGQAAAVYDQAAHRRAEEQAFGSSGIGYFAFFYPPTFLLACAAFGWMPYLVAFYVWIGSTLGAFLLAVRRIMGPTIAILPIAAYPAIFLTIGTGQNSFLTAALFAFGTVLLGKRPFAAGLLLGALIFKPHFGLLLPIALIAGREWRAFTGAAVMTLILAVSSALLFGTDAWQAFLELSRGVSQTFQAGQVEFFLIVSPFSASRMLGGSVGLSYGVQAAVTLTAMVFVAIVWRRNMRPAARAAVLISATMISLPVILFYDLTLAAVAIAWILRDAATTGYLRWEKSALLVVFCTPLVAIAAAYAAKWPLGLIATVLLFVLSVRRAFTFDDAENPEKRAR
ncbi:MAG TPA: glycosyltransferase family 87 protein [Aliidongia sp.]|nr:glycosyltransferase family 87 protein [Aliidongia sp.]